VIAEAGGFGGTRAGFLAHQGVVFERERAFLIVSIQTMQVFRHDQPEHAVAKEFESLIGHLRVGAGMSQRALQQIAIRKFVAEPLFEVTRRG